MELQFERIRLDGYIVDFKKQTVSRAGHIVQLQSKILQVLACLIAAQGQLVTIEQLMNQVWGNTIVSPNTLQRCIAQLRKAFDDNSQTQRLIKTYPRRGYELLLKPEPYVEVDSSQQLTTYLPYVQSEKQDLTLTATLATRRPGLSQRKLLLPLILLLLSGVSGAWYLTDKRVTNIDLRHAPLQLRFQSQLTATEAHEQLPTYSADGNWIAFSRFESFCHGQIWLQQVATKTEWQLSDQPQRFESLAFSANSQQLAAISTKDCAAPQHPLCWQLQLYQLSALPHVQQLPLGDCEHRQLSQLYWQDAEYLWMLRRSAITGLRALIRYRLSTKQTEEIFNGGDVLSYQLLPNGDISLLAHQGSAETVLHRLNSEGQLLLSTKLIYGHWSAFPPPALHYLPSRDQLMLGSAGQLFFIRPNGELHWQQQSEALQLSQFRVHPTQHKLIASEGVTDLDLLSWQRQGQQLQPIFRSHAFESQARIAPAVTDQPTQIAFVSNRSGQNEIWLAVANELRQLSQFKLPVQINGMVWQQDAQALLLNLNDQLYQLTLTGQLRQLPSPVRLKKLHQLTAQNKLLIEYQHEFTEMLALLDLTTAELTPLQAGNFIDARIDDHDTLWFSDQGFRLFRHQRGQQVQAVVRDIAVSAFTVVDDVLLITSKTNKLLQYQLENLTPQHAPVNLPAGSWLNDANTKLVLLAVKTDIRTELLELTMH